MLLFLSGVSGEALEEAEKRKAEGEVQQAANGKPAAIADGPKPEQEKKDDWIKPEYKLG